MKKAKMTYANPNSIDNADIVRLMTFLYRFEPKTWQLCV